MPANLIGTGPNQVPTNQMLGRMAAQNPNAMVLEPQPGATPAKPGDMVFELTTNTTLTIKVKGTDGVVRSGAIALA
jgi:hypothetical protein